MVKKVFTFKKLIASIFMVLTATLVMNAQTENPWHVVVYDNTGKEVASHSIEIITDLTVSADASEVDFLLDNGSTYPYPITSTFAFEQRAGNGTAIETIAAPKWNVSYSDGTLHFTKQVNNVAVYTMSGILIAKISGNSTCVPVSLAKGLYIVQADGKAAKLLVADNGATSIQPVVANTVQQSTSVSSPTLLRAATATLKTLWNINAGGTITPIDISSVNTFYITTDNTIVFAMKDGNTIQLADYQGTSFSTQPTTSQNTNWDMANTILCCGATYGVDFAWIYEPFIFKVEFISVLTKNEIVIYDVFNEKELRYQRSSITESLLGKAGRISVAENDGYFPAMSYYLVDEGYETILFASLIDNQWVEPLTSKYSFNGNTNVIPCNFKLAGGNLTVSYTNADGTLRQHTFSAE